MQADQTSSLALELTPTSLTRGRLLVRNVAWSFGTQCVPMAVGLLTIPILIRGIGTDRFGLLTLAWIFLGYFSLFDLGLGRALTKLVAEKLGLGDVASTPALVWTALSLMLGLGLMGTLFVGVLSPWLVRDALRVDAALEQEALWSFRMMAALLPVVISIAGLRGVMEAFQQFRSINVARMIFGILSLVGPLLVLPFSQNLVAVVGVMALSKVLTCAVLLVLCLRTVPGMSREVRFRLSVVRSLAGFGGWMTVANIVNPLMVQMDRFLVGALVSTAAVAYYTTPYELVTKYWFLSNTVLGVIFPAFATSYVSDRDKTVRIFGRGLKFIFLILFPLVVVTVAFAPDVLKLWLGAEFALQSTRVLQCLALGVFLNGLAQVPSALLQGVGRPDLTAILHVVELPLYLALAWVLIRGRGIEGAAMAWTARTALDFVLFFATTRRVLPVTADAVRRLVGALVVALPVIALCALPYNLAGRASVVLIVAVAFLVATWNLVLSTDEKALVQNTWETLRRRMAPKPGRLIVDALAESEQTVPSVRVRL